MNKIVFYSGNRRFPDPPPSLGCLKAMLAVTVYSPLKDCHRLRR